MITVRCKDEWLLFGAHSTRDRTVESRRHATIISYPNYMASARKRNETISSNQKGKFSTDRYIVTLTCLISEVSERLVSSLHDMRQHSHTVFTGAGGRIRLTGCAGGDSCSMDCTVPLAARVLLLVDMLSNFCGLVCGCGCSCGCCGCLCCTCGWGGCCC